ncbi:universal stress protein [Actinokineospora soli]|uniref:Universal stress protein n=1 Tax=Actinokineospora soli TaxID=1048753 RepID=A0ABW2TPU3_9PSEU
MPAPIIAAVDGSASALDAVRHAARDARQHNLPLRLLHAYPPPPPRLPAALDPDDAWVAAMTERGDRILAEAAAVARATGVEPVLDQRMGPPSTVLAAASEDAYEIVLGSRGLGGFRGLIAGSLALSMAAHAHCPVVVVRGSAPEDGPVVVGVDGSPVSEAALAFAYEQAARRGVALRAVHAWQDTAYTGGYVAIPILVDWDAVVQDETALLAERLAGWAEKYPEVRVERFVVRSQAARALLDLAEGAQLVVVGSRGHSPLVGVGFGTTAQAVLHHAECPVAVVRP